MSPQAKEMRICASYDSHFIYFFARAFRDVEFGRRNASGSPGKSKSKDQFSVLIQSALFQYTFMRHTRQVRIELSRCRRKLQKCAGQNKRLLLFSASHAHSYSFRPQRLISLLAKSCLLTHKHIEVKRE